MFCCVFFYLNEICFFLFSHFVPLFCTLVKLATTVTVAEYMGNYFQTAGNFLGLVFLLCKVLVGSSSLMMDCMALP